jgi:phosphatidylserine synthase
MNWSAILIVSASSFLFNVPLGLWRERYKKFSLPWFVILHLSVPFIIALRIYLKANLWFIPLFIALAVIGQLSGKKLYYKLHPKIETNKN